MRPHPFQPPRGSLDPADACVHRELAHASAGGFVLCLLSADAPIHGATGPQPGAPDTRTAAQAVVATAGPGVARLLEALSKGMLRWQALAEFWAIEAARAAAGDTDRGRGPAGVAAWERWDGTVRAPDTPAIVRWHAARGARGGGLA